jgi:hypothetical protein
MLAFPSVPDARPEPLYLHEAPLRRQKIDPVERWPLDPWQVANRTPEPSPVRIVIRGIGDRTVRPSVFCPAVQAGFVFNGIVPDGRTLVVDASDGAALDDEPVDEWLIEFNGAIADFSREGQSWAIDERPTTAPFDGESGRTSDAPAVGTPPAPPGVSEWRFTVAEGVYDGADFDYCVVRGPSDPIAIWDGDFSFDHSVFDYPASGIVGMAWDERVTCAFKLLLPAFIPAPKPEVKEANQAKDATDAKDAQEGGSTAPPRQPDAVARVAGVMPRFKAAGVQALVDAARDGWVLGSSVLRATDAAAGEGIEFHATRALNPRTELFVP